VSAGELALWLQLADEDLAMARPSSSIRGSTDEDARTSLGHAVNIVRSVRDRVAGQA
jgi:hypothetical protein